MYGYAGGILLVDQRTQTVHDTLKISRGYMSGFIGDMQMRFGEAVARGVVQSGKPVLIESVPEGLTPTTGITSIGMNIHLFKSFVSIPLKAKGSVLGVLNVFSYSPHRFSEDDMKLFQAVAVLVGVAIEQADLYARLRQDKERYRGMARYILAAQEEERRRIARELHDETSQALSALAFNQQALMEMAETSSGLSDVFKGQLERTQSLVVQINTEINKVIYDLRPTLLDTLGLVAAIRQYAEDILEPLGIKTAVHCKGDSMPLLPEVEVGLFRVAQGIIGNIAKHSKASAALVTIRYSDDDVVISIEDNGRGFNTSKLAEADKKGRGSRLLGMKERVKLMGASYSVESKENKGTCVTVKVPLIWSDEDAEDKSLDSR
ncbi:MAG: GAF domain-containing sensor histidine kinase [Chloroflexota bacterium]|nr:GAF domain-containing sensor histidine kinase [Chloroflexota bacterium]